MTEIEQLKTDLATMEKALDFLKKHECPNVALDVKSICDLMKKNIADLEAQQQVDPFAKAKAALFNWITVDAVLNHKEKRSIYVYVASLQAKVAELEEEINTSEFTWMATHAARLLKERDDALAKVTELENELRCERIDGGKVRADRKSISAERNREKLAELTTIDNAIPPACGEAMELVERRIEPVKKEMQG